MIWFNKKSKGGVLSPIVAATEEKTIEVATPREAVKVMTSVYGPIASVSYYIPEDPADTQFYYCRDFKGSTVCNIRAQSTGKGYEVQISNGDVSARTHVDQKVSPALVAAWVGRRSRTFILEKGYTAGDVFIRETVVGGIDPERDVIQEVSENHWIIRRSYDSGKKKFAEFRISGSPDEGFTVELNYGHAVKYFSQGRRFSSNYVYRFLKQGSNKKRLGSLF